MLHWDDILVLHFVHVDRVTPPPFPLHQESRFDDLLISISDNSSLPIIMSFDILSLRYDVIRGTTH
jgi:hypothetical protein